MAQANIAGTKLRMTFETGVDAKGQPVYKTKTFSNIKTGATADQLLQTAQALSVLVKDSLHSIERNDNSDIIA